MHSPRPTRPELLESRIAPAQFFLSGTALTVVDATGADVNKTVLTTATGADLAVVLHKGDTLVLDTDGDHVLDVGETVYAKLTGGSAAFFIEDKNTNTKVDANEITGIAAGNGFNAIITGDVNGDIATTFNPNGEFTQGNIEAASIAGLKVSGRVIGNVLAGLNITNVAIGGDTPSLLASVKDIRSGDAASSQGTSYDGGAHGFGTSFTPAPGAAAGTISKIKLAGGATNIRTGGGGDNPNGPGGKGGDISDVTMLETAGAFIIVPGDGGVSTKIGSKGGAGGSSTRINITSSENLPDTVASYIGAGFGGTGDTGGKGGSTSKDTVHFTAATSVNLYIYGRYGGAGGIPNGKSGSGGAGGSVSSVTLTADAAMGFAGFYGGDGGNAGDGTNGKGGAGGSVSKITYNAVGGLYAPDFEAGDGGDGKGTGAGGAGGSVSGLTISQGNVTHDQDIFGGKGGNAQMGKGGAGGSITRITQTAGTTGEDIDIRAGNGGTSANGSGGNGGSIGTWVLTAGNIGDFLNVQAGVGGNGGNSQMAKGGNGGAVTGFTATLADVTGSTASFHAGSGGSGGSGGAGGAASKVNVTLGGHVANYVSITGGDAGAAISGDGKGGKGGSLSTITVSKTGGVGDTIFISSGNGGSGSGKGAGGDGGTTSKVTAKATSAINALYVGGGDGGDSAGDGARGGKGGGVSSFTLDSTPALSEAAVLYGGDGGDAGGADGKGGNGGSVNTVKLNAATSTVRINNGPNNGNPHAGDGGTGTLSAGGTGGGVSGVTGSVGVLVVNAQRGGNADLKGGDGGAVKSIKLAAIGQFVQLIAGGVGGNANMDGTAGRGGSISSITIPGAIGNFTAAFGVDPVATPDSVTPQMGGLVAGLAGSKGGAAVDPTLNGSITSVTANTIAAIIAGNVFNSSGLFDGTQANALTTSNAVSKLTGIKADVLGADAIAPAGFTFTDNANGANGIFQLGDGDTARDGLIIVLGTPKLPIVPLRIEAVVLT